MTTLASASLRVHLQNLRWCGYCRLSAAEPRRRRQLHELFRTFIATIIGVYVSQECIYAFLVRHDLGTLSRVLFLLICHLTTIAKHVCFYTKAQQIDELINTLDEPLFNQEGEVITRLLVNTARSTTRLVYMFTSAAVLTCLLWAILPAIEFARGKEVQFFFWMFGVRYTESPGFEIALLYMFTMNSLLGFANTSIDVFIVTFLHQGQTQMNILRMNFEKLSNVCNDRKRNSKKNHELLTSELLKCLRHYEIVCRLTAKLQEVFGAPILILFLCGAWMLCMAAYRSLTINLVSIEFLSMVGFIGCILLELFLYCYYGNEVTVESNRLIESIYNMDWLSAPVGFQKSLVLVMERAKRPLRPVAGGIIPLSLGTYITVLKSSYSFFAVLRQTK